MQTKEQKRLYMQEYETRPSVRLTRKAYRQSQAGKKAKKRYAVSKKGKQQKRDAAERRRQRGIQKKSPIAIPYTRHQIFDRDQWTCQSCWKKVRDNVPWSHSSKSTVDHIIPLAEGGADCASNVQTLCWPCNHAKGNRIGQNDQLRLRLAG